MYKRFSILLSSIALFSLVGCSSLIESTRESLLGEKSSRKQVKKEVKWVSKSQYDGLMAKYKNLNDKYENLKTEKVTSSDAFNQIDEMVISPPEKGAEVVDAFGPNGIVVKNKPVKKRSKQNPIELDIDKVNQEVHYYKTAVRLFENQKIDESLKLFQTLEHSTNSQIAVRAKKFIGDIYFQKKQYDLSLQVYDSIISNYAFSGKVIPALRNAALCAKKLGLKNKRAKYESILKDFFKEEI